VPQNGYTPQAIGPRTARAVELRGLRPVVGDYARFGVGLLAGLPWSGGGTHGRFQFAGEEYAYLYHRHKFTWLTERAVEVPIAEALVQRRRGARVLEVGNVLSHYQAVDHLVADKYEQAPGVVNRDVLDLGGMGEFDLVLAISTLEHVGRDEQPRDPGKAVRAVHALRELLAPGGRLVMTVPVGYHLGLDAALRDGGLGAARLRALRRERLGPHWREVPVESAWGASYDFLLYSARAVVVAELDRDP
jgi:SAM-dependent methyltransferase